MRVSLSLLAFAVFTACSTVENVEQNTASNLEVSTADVANFNQSSDLTPDEVKLFARKDAVNYTNGGDWRTNTMYHNYALNKITRGGKYSFHYTTRDNQQFWINFKFNPKSPNVYYAITTPAGLIQHGLTTARMWDTDDFNKSTIRFDVPMKSATHLPQTIYMHIYRNGNADAYRVRITDQLLNGHYTGYTGYPSQIRKHWQKVLFNSIRRDAMVQNHDWRNFGYKHNDLFDWLIRSGAQRSFNYYTAPDGERFWINYSFFNDRKDIWYQIVSSKKGSIQYGYTTVKLNALVVGKTYAGRIDFDVKFSAATRLPKKLYLYPTKGYGNNHTHRGFISEHRYDQMPSSFSTKFRFTSGYQNF